VRTAFENFKHLFAPLASNCREFRDRWDRAASGGAGDLTGRWEGEWISGATGHRGPLRCVLERIDDSGWRATFRGGYAGVFRACYSTILTMRRDGERWTFSGESDIGWLAGGVYSSEGEASANELVARYRSRYDQGEFRLRRVR
jgi:hypothetical protein